MVELLKNMLYARYHSTGIFGRQEFWDSLKKGGKYSATYSELNEVKNAQYYYGQAKQEQLKMVEKLTSKYSKQLFEATNFIKTFNNTKVLANKESEKTFADISKEIADFFNSPFKSNEGWMYKVGSKNQVLSEKALKQKAKIKLGQKNIELNNILNELLGPKANIDLLKKFNELIKQGFESGDVVSYYASQKGMYIEELITQIINQLNGYKGTALQTGEIIYQGEPLGEDIVVLNEKTLKDIENLKLTANSTIDDEMYEALKKLEAFSIQVKSGQNQALFNANNKIYKFTMNELAYNSKIKKLIMLNEWNYGEGKYKGQTKIMNSERVGSDKKGFEYTTGYFVDYVKNENLTALVTYIISKDSKKLENFYRSSEYQVFWSPKYGFVTFEKYFLDNGLYWAMPENQRGFDYRQGFKNREFTIGLRKF